MRWGQISSELCSLTPAQILEQASQLAQDIETSLKFSSKRKVIPKTGEQPNPNTHTTKDSKDKSVISESPKNAKGNQYFKCQDYGHIVTQCPSRNFLVRGTDSDDDELKTVIHEPVGSAYDTI